MAGLSKHFIMFGHMIRNSHVYGDCRTGHGGKDTTVNYMKYLMSQTLLIIELTNSYRMAVKTQLYLCDIQGVGVCTKVLANSILRYITGMAFLKIVNL